MSAVGRVSCARWRDSVGSVWAASEQVSDGAAREVEGDRPFGWGAELLYYRGRSYGRPDLLIASCKRGCSTVKAHETFSCVMWQGVDVK